MCGDGAHASGLREESLSVLNQFWHLSYRLENKHLKGTEQPKMKIVYSSSLTLV